MINVLKISGKTFLAAFLINPQISYADVLTSADVLEWTESQQNSFFQHSISMAAIVAARTGQHGGVVRCVNYWYSAQSQSKRNDYIRTKLGDFSDYHPQGIILAVLEEACGDFTREDS